MAAIEFRTKSSMEPGDLTKASSQSEILAFGSCPPNTRSRVASRLRFNVLWCTQPDGRPSWAAHRSRDSQAIWPSRVSSLGG